MSKISRYKDFYNRQMLIKQSNKKIKLSEYQIEEFQSIISEGKKHDIVSLYLRNNKVNENYSLILEDKEILDETKKIVCTKFYKDRIKEIGIQTRKYLEYRNIPESDIKLIEENLESILTEGLLDWTTDKLKKAGNAIVGGAKYVGGVIGDLLGCLTDGARATWDAIVEDIFKPGLEALKSVATKLFGAEIVAQIEITAKKVLNSIDDFVKTSKSIFDKVYATLKDLAKNLVNVVKEIWNKIKEVLGKVWEFIKNHALKIVPGIKAKIAKVKDLGNKVNSEHLSNEMKMFSEDFQDMKMYFGGKLKKITGNSVEEVATSSGNKIMATEGSEEGEKKEEVVNDSFIWDSLKGFMLKNPNFNTDELINLHETKVEKVYEAEDPDSEKEVKHEVHSAESRGIKKWIIGIVMWVLSPFGKLMEIAGEAIGKGLTAIPAWLSGKLGTLLEGIKNLVKHAGKYVAIGTIAAFVAGVAAEGFALSTHLPGDWVKEAGEKLGLGHAVHKAEEIYAETGRGIENMTGINLKDMKESKIKSFQNFNKINESDAPSKGINWKGLAIGAGSALLAFLVSVFTHAIPGLHMGFEIVSLVILLIATLGWCFSETEWGKNLASKNNNISAMSKAFYSFIHAH